MRIPALFRAMAVAVAGACAAALPPYTAAADRLYYYVDEQGVYHFSNVPADARYRPLTPGAGPLLPREGPVPPREGPTVPGGPSAALPGAPNTGVAPATLPLASPAVEEETSEDLELEPDDVDEGRGDRAR